MEIKGKDVIVDINRVKPNTWNPKESVKDSKENQKKFNEIKYQIKTKGLFEAITVREKGDEYEILDGYHRWLACNELGFEQVRINTLGEVDDQLARAITIIKEQAKVPLDEILVGDVVSEIAKVTSFSDVKDLLGYDDETLQEYLDIGEFDWSQFDSERPSDKEQEKTSTIKCPHCGEEFEAD